MNKLHYNILRGIEVLCVIIFITFLVWVFIKEDYKPKTIQDASQSYTLVSSAKEFHVIDNQTNDTIYTERMNYPNSSKLQEALTSNQE